MLNYRFLIKFKIILNNIILLIELGKIEKINDFTQKLMKNEDIAEKCKQDYCNNSN